jgi:hypothetical protein
MARQLIRFAVVAGLALAGRPDSAWAQSSPAYPVVVGSRIRIEVPTVLAGRFEGTVTEIDEHSLLIELENRPVIRVPRQAITQLDVSLGRRRQFRKGAMIGAGIGALVIFGLSANEIEESGITKPQLVAIGLAPGAFWGATIGALVKTERWAAVPMAPVPVSSTSGQGRRVLTLASLRF